MKKAKICAVIVNGDLAIIKEVERCVDLFEVRIDLIGNGWQEIAKQLDKPWIASNRSAAERGRWRKDERKRTEELLIASELGADMIDVELGTTDLAETVRLIKGRAKCLLSHHDFKGTPPLNEMKEIIQRQLAAGADVCKIVTTARKFEDNITVLQLILEFPTIEVVAFAMGTLGLASRILCPVIGGSFTYASIKEGKESAPGQITVNALHQIYAIMAR